MSLQLSTTTGDINDRFKGEEKNELMVEKKSLKTTGPDRGKLEVKMVKRRTRGTAIKENVPLCWEVRGGKDWMRGRRGKIQVGVQELRDVKEVGEKEASMCPAPDKASN